MGDFADGYKGDTVFQREDDWETPRPRKSRVAPYFWKNRFASSRYVRNITRYKKEVIIRVIDRGFGNRHANVLMRYLMRDLEYQKERGETTVRLENQDREIITGSNYLDTLQKWSSSFYSTTDIIDEKLYKEIEDYALRLAVLKSKKSDKVITAEERQELDNLKNNNPLKEKMKTARKDFTHLLLSLGGKPDRKNEEAAIRNFLDMNFKAKGFEYLAAFHKDTDNHHCHVMVKNRNRFCEKSFSLDKYDLFVLRHDLARNADILGIDRTASRVYDRDDFIKALKEKPEKILKAKNQYEAKLLKEGDADSFNAFIFRKNLNRQLNRFIEQTKRQAEKDSSLNKTVRELKKIKKSFVNTRSDEFFKMREATVKELEKFDKKVAREFKEAISWPSIGMPEKNRQQIMRMAGELEKKRRTEVVETIEAIREYKKTAPKEAQLEILLLLEKLSGLFKEKILKNETVKGKTVKKPKEKDDGMERE